MFKVKLLSHLSFTLGGPLRTLPEGRLKRLRRLRGVWSVWKEAAQDQVQNRAHRLYRACLEKSEKMSNEQKTPGGSGVKEMETDGEAKRRRQ